MRFSLRSLFAFESTTALFNWINASQTDHKISHEHSICYRTVFELVLDRTSCWARPKSQPSLWRPAHQTRGIIDPTSCQSWNLKEKRKQSLSRAVGDLHKQGIYNFLLSHRQEEVKKKRKKKEVIIFLEIPVLQGKGMSAYFGPLCTVALWRFTIRHSPHFSPQLQMHRSPPCTNT